jgi:GNAT superfamily N-acetyltransferase
MATIRELTAADRLQFVQPLAAVLLDCVRAGASVSFMASLTEAEAESFFEHVFEQVQRGERIVLAAFINSSLVGTVQVVTATPLNQPHRADIAKLLVHRSARRQGVARQLMEAAEKAASLSGKTLLVLDTVTGGPAEKLYTGLGWNRVGVIPRYALFPNGSYCDTTIFWKDIG